MPVTVVRDLIDPFKIVDDSPRKIKKAKPIKSPAMYVRIQGGLVQFKRTGSVASPPPSRVGRVIGQFSNASRLRLLKFLNTIDWRAIGESSFITLTYPDIIDSNKYRDRSKHRYLILRALESYFGAEFAAIWRIEWEVRKSGMYTGLLRPHFHLCCLDLPPMGNERVKHLWGKILGYKNDNLQVDVARVTGFQGCLKYIAKYVSKIPTLDIPLHHNNAIAFGRHWGTTRKSIIPICPVRVLRKLTDDEMTYAIHWAGRHMAKYDVHLENGFTLLGENFSNHWANWLKNG